MPLPLPLAKLLRRSPEPEDNRPASNLHPALSEAIFDDDAYYCKERIMAFVRQLQLEGHKGRSLGRALLQVTQSFAYLIHDGISIDFLKYARDYFSKAVQNSEDMSKSFLQELNDSYEAKVRNREAGGPGTEFQ